MPRGVEITQDGRAWSETLPPDLRLSAGQVGPLAALADGAASKDSRLAEFSEQLFHAWYDTAKVLLIVNEIRRMFDGIRPGARNERRQPRASPPAVVATVLGPRLPLGTCPTMHHRQTIQRNFTVTDFFTPWCKPPHDEAVGNHTARLLVSRDDEVGIDAVVSVLPRSYAKKKNLRRIAERHGKNGVANLLSNKVPTTQRSRSGDMGEILGTAYVQTTLGYSTGPSRLIERDHQEWALRGDDILGARLNGQALELVKVEAKSRAQARKATITEAREGLRRNGDLASPHSLTQFAERLLKRDEVLSDAINDVLQNDGLRPEQLAHVMFIFAGNHPITHVRDDLNAYEGRVAQTTVTVRVGAHQDFIAKSYTAVVNRAP